jgi:hypothetical protein
MKDTDNRSPDEIESDIARTRADFSSTIDAIQHKLSPSEMMDNAVDYALSTPPGAFSMNLVNSVRDNPIPVALIGIGIAWLFAADRRRVEYEPVGRYPRSVRRPVRSAYADTGYDGMDEADYHAARDYGTDDKDEGLMQRMASKTSDTAQGLKESASNVGQKLSDTASSVTGRVQQAGQSAQARMSEMGRRSQMQMERAKDRFGQMMDEQPLVLGALGLAVGAALGAAIPSTRRENEMMGSVRDDLLDRAKETAREQAETLKQSAQRVADTAKQEAGRVAEEMSNAQRKDQGTSTTTGTGTSQFGGTTGSSSIH